ncbi:MAG: ABC transporter ATP-binding protein [Desulfatibacillaceae bacterium]
MEPILELNRLTMDFGGLRALDRITFNVNKSEIMALIGPNGAGKTTIFNCITGMYNPTGGDVHVTRPDGKRLRINGYKPNKVTEQGLARTFQNIRLFQNMTVLENVMIGRHCRMHATILGAMSRSRYMKREEQEVVEYCYRLLRQIGLDQFVNELAKNLPYGMQRRLEIARALATEPFMILLDEPAAGMNPLETDRLMKLINRIRDEFGVTVLLIEHDMKLVMSISERIVVMDHGKLIAEGRPEEIRKDPEVIRAYLGEEVDA